MFTYSIVAPEEILRYCANMKKRPTEHGLSFDGFSLFTEESIKRGFGSKIFVVCWNKDQIIGVLKLSKSSLYPQNVWVVAIIDVHVDYRNMKVATNMYKALNSWVTETMILVWTDLTKDGQAFKINEVGMRNLTNCQTLPNIECFESIYGYDHT